MVHDIAVVTNKSLFSRYPKGFFIKPDVADLPIINLLEQSYTFTLLHAFLHRLFVTDNTAVPWHHERVSLDGDLESSAFFQIQNFPSFAVQ